VFTGLVETMGRLRRRTARGPDARLVVEGALEVSDSPIELGESIAVDGVCLTVAAIVSPGSIGEPVVFEADASAETLAKTTLGALETGAAVNLERAVRLGGRMGGHIVSGHVDGVGRVADKTPLGAAVKVVFEAPRELMRFVAPKGSVAVSGVSLTVNGVSPVSAADGAHQLRDRFDVVLVPHTREKTSLDALGVGAPVNLEVDLLARYVARLLESASGANKTEAEGPAGADASWLDRLARAGYM
jgi:riboflavin synthase